MSFLLSDLTRTGKLLFGIRGRENEAADLDRTGGVREKKGVSFQRMVAQAFQSLLRTQRHDSQLGPRSMFACSWF